MSQMPKVKKENLVVFGGWTRTENSYKKLIKLAPKNWSIDYLSYTEEIKKGELDKFFQKVIITIEKKNPSKVILLGHSLGGALAMEFSAVYPEKIQKLILLDAEGVYKKEPIHQVIRNFLRTHLHYGRKKALENLKSSWRIIKKPIVHLRLAKIAHKFDFLDKAPNIKTPTLILWGEKDRLTPLWQGKKLNSLIPNSKFVILKDLDHDWPIHKPELFWENL